MKQSNATPETLSASARALAAWESATVQTLNPLLSAEKADALWEAIVANRNAPDAGVFAEALAKIVSASIAQHLVAGKSVLDNLRAILATAAPAAHTE